MFLPLEIRTLAIINLLKTQMGTNLLNLSPSSQTSELVVVPGYGYCGWPSAWTLLALCLPLSDPYLPLQPFTTVTFGSPFETLADSFREEVA
jgi:hypothetical protein